MKKTYDNNIKKTYSISGTDKMTQYVCGESTALKVPANFRCRDSCSEDSIRT